MDKNVKQIVKWVIIVAIIIVIAYGAYYIYNNLASLIMGRVVSGVAKGVGDAAAPIKKIL